MWKYIFIGFDQDYFDSCFAGLKKSENYFFLRDTSKNGLFSIVQKICCTERINKYFEIPLKEVWMNSFKEWTQLGDYDICFIFSKSQSWLLQYKNGKYIEKLRKIYPECKIILYLADQISSYKKFNINFFKDKCDYVISYDEKDAKQQGILYCPLPYYPRRIEENSNIESVDFFFCGRSKNRLKTLISTFDWLTEHGFSCLFYVIGVTKDNQVPRKGIIYNTPLTYGKYLQHLNKSRGVIEIVQDGSTGDTLRVKEALAYCKVLVSNNTSLIDKSYFNRNQTFIIENKDSLDENALRNAVEQKFSSVHFDELKKLLEELCERQ